MTERLPLVCPHCGATERVNLGARHCFACLKPYDPDAPMPAEVAPVEQQMADGERVE